MSTARQILTLIPLVTLTLAPLTTLAAQEHDHHAKRDGEHKTTATASKHPGAAQALPPDLRKLLIKEMQLIDAGMGKLLSAISAGDWIVVEEIAGKTQHSFIHEVSV